MLLPSIKQPYEKAAELEAKRRSSILVNRSVASFARVPVSKPFIHNKQKEAKEIPEIPHFPPDSFSYVVEGKRKKTR